MTESFIKKLAESRADCIFQPNYYKDVTDSWYLDEKSRFENLEIGPEGRKPTEDEADIYMKYLLNLFKEYEDRFNPYMLAQNFYANCINRFTDIFEFVDYGNKTYSRFNIDEETIQKLKDIANIFITKYNDFNKYDIRAENKRYY